MKNFIKSKYFTYILAAAFSIAFVAFFIFNPSHAYFQVHKDFIGVNTAKVDLLFDKFDVNDEASDEPKKYGDLTVNPKADWGTVDNPYVIDDTNHISNLSVLQKSGYFNSKNHQCFFVVCTPDGYPVAIDCDGMEIAPIGSPSRPFTGNIQGAPLAATDSSYPEGSKFTNEYTVKYSETEFKAFTVSQSAIADLKIVATEATPDIGFFGALGYVGTYNPEVPENTEANPPQPYVHPFLTPVNDSKSQFNGQLFNATVDNLLFADITVTDSQDAGSGWWSKFAPDKAHPTSNETHHVGVAAGHSSWATLTNLSVYYSPSSANSDGNDTTNVAAFELDSSSSNYYTITGILGTLEYTNPTKVFSETGVLQKLDGKGAVNDSDITDKIVTGGGGGLSGILTGYMRAENIYNSNQNTSAVIPDLEDLYSNGYDIKDLTKKDTNGKIVSLFEYVDVTETKGGFLGTGFGATKTNYRYYFFRDSIFTFAMSARRKVNSDNSLSSDGKVDFIVQIWDVTQQDDLTKIINAPLIKITENAPNPAAGNGWTQVDSGQMQKLYELSAINPSSLKAGDKYVILYRDAEDKMYSFVPSSAEDATNGYKTMSFTLDSFVLQTGENTSISYAPKYFKDNGKYILFNANNEDTNYRIPEISGEQRAPSGYLLFERTVTKDTEGNVTEQTSSASPVTINGNIIYYSLLPSGAYSAVYVNDKNEVVTDTRDTTVIESIIDGKVTSTTTVTYEAVKVWLGLETIYYVDNSNHTSEDSSGKTTTSYYFANGLEYQTNRPLTAIDLDNSHNSFGTTSSAGQYGSPKFFLGTNSQKVDGFLGLETLYWLNWTFPFPTLSSSDLSNEVSIEGNFCFQSNVIVERSYYYHTAKLFFKDTSFVPALSSDSNNPYDAAQTPAYSTKPTVEGAADSFLIFKVTNPTAAVSLPAKNWVPSSTTAEFNASTHVLFYDGTEFDAANGGTHVDSYTITPIRALEWNSGNGAYLEQLNHAVKLAQATAQFHTIKMENLFGEEYKDRWWAQIASNLLNANSGGLVPAEIGTNGKAYTIPAGMIAFDILEASQQKPSYINIIVAVNPEQDPSWIGIYGDMDDSAWNTEFDLVNDVKEKMILPSSKKGNYSWDLENHAVKISSYYTGSPNNYTRNMQTKEVTNEDGTTSKVFDDYYYTYLGGEVVLVGYTFTVEKPGIYLLGSSDGPMTVCYFSVDGAAGEGGDGTGGSPLGDIDFVYDNGSAILSVDRKFEGAHVVTAEVPEDFYYPSYYYVRMLPSVENSTTIAVENLKIRRYISTVTYKERRRYIRITKDATQNNAATSYVGILDMYQDNDATTPTS